MNRYWTRAACLMAFALAVEGSESTKALTNEGVVVLARAGYNERFLLELIRNKDAKFDTSVEGLVYLAKQGVSEKIVKAILTADREAALKEEREDVEPAKMGPAPVQAPVKYRVTKHKVWVPEGMKIDNAQPLYMIAQGQIGFQRAEH